MSAFACCNVGYAWTRDSSFTIPCIVCGAVTDADAGVPLHVFQFFFFTPLSCFLLLCFSWDPGTGGIAGRPLSPLPSSSSSDSFAGFRARTVYLGSSVHLALARMSACTCPQAPHHVGGRVPFRCVGAPPAPHAAEGRVSPAPVPPPPGDMGRSGAPFLGRIEPTRAQLWPRGDGDLGRAPLSFPLDLPRSLPLSLWVCLTNPVQGEQREGGMPRGG